ncbi:MerR family transcriptional regulator [Pseudonocardia sp. ICBG1293]|uniref:MerR family transcriptional regulator n=1 Tax=Pseudonocardia sp. ICBG1293 TaxID=2844382 RepID=UPI001CC954FF|nr:MerR family transcriptional regulator [Pseudonocardia sp. ICBG1293]
MTDRPPTRANLASTSAAARSLGVHQSTLSRWASTGVVHPEARTVGGHMRWDLQKLRDELEAAGAVLPTSQD